MATTPATTSGTNPQPPAKTFKEKFVEGDISRRGEDTSKSEYNKEIDASATTAVPTKSSALFDQEGMDPYEVFTQIQS